MFLTGKRLYDSDIEILLKFAILFINMKTLEEIEQILKAQKPYLKEKYHISEVGVFGSYVRGEQTRKSDVDVLVTFDSYEGLGLKYFGIGPYLSDLIGVKVDLVDKKGLKPIIGKYILEEAVYL